MTTPRPEPSPRLRVGDSLPAFELPRVPDGTARRFPSASRNALLLLVLPRRPEPWGEYLAALSRAAADIEQWYARVVVVLHAGLHEARDVPGSLREGLTVLADAGGGLHRRLGLAAERAGVHVVDRYGQAYCVLDAADAAGLPEVGELEEWAKFLATQCPECGVIDAPGHEEWRVTP